MGVYRNPILPGSNPDPSVCRVGDEYFMVTSTFEYLPGLPVHRSTNLVDWETIGHVIHRPGQLDYTGISASKGLYAPTIRYHDGVFHVVCTVIPGEAEQPQRSGHFLVTATDPAGPWSDPVWFDGIGGIDPSLTFDGDRVWLCGTELQEPGAWVGQCDVWLTELDRHTFAAIGPRITIWQGALLGAGWAEGPHIYRHRDGGWMLLAAEGGTDRDHAICVAYAETVTGPYVGDVGNPRLTHRFLGDRAPIANIGHADLVDTPDGHTFAVMLGTQQDAGVNSLCGRQTHLVPVEWERGRPLFAPGTGRVDLLMEADAVPNQAPRETLIRDEFGEGELDHAWNAVRWHPQEFVSLTPHGIRLAATADEPTAVARTAFMGRRVPQDHAELTAWVRLEPEGGGLRGGLLLRTTETALVELYVDASGAGAVSLVDDGVATHVCRFGSTPGERIELTMRLDRHALTLVVDAVEVATIDVTELATGRVLWFLGSWFGPFAVGSGSLAVEAVELRMLPDMVAQP